MGRTHIPSSRLTAALFSAVQRRVLSLLFNEPARELSTSEMIRLVDSGTGAVHRELARLAESGLIVMRQLGNQKLYRANRDSPIFEELRGIVLKTFGLVGPLKEALAGYGGQVRTAFVYGSVARGADTARSDIDLMVIGEDLSYSGVFDALRDTETRLGRTINPTVMSADEWDRKLKRKNAFVIRVGAQPKLFVR